MEASPSLPERKLSGSGRCQEQIHNPATPIRHSDGFNRPVAQGSNNSHMDVSFGSKKVAHFLSKLFLSKYKKLEKKSFPNFSEIFEISEI